MRIHKDSHSLHPQLLSILRDLSSWKPRAGYVGGEQDLVCQGRSEGRREIMKRWQKNEGILVKYLCVNATDTDRAYGRTHTHTYIYIYMYKCRYTRTHTHTRIYIYIYICSE